MGRIAFIRHTMVWLASLYFVSLLGCREKPSQIAEEYNSAGFLVSQMGSYENRFPDTPITNMQQIVMAIHPPYPVRLHHQLRRFGEDAGFKNSIFEKYAFVPTRFTNRAFNGENVLLNADPFPDREGKYGRMIFSKWRPGWDGWAIKWYPEERVQQIFRDAGQIVPKADPVPPPSDLPPPYRPPLGQRLQAYFADVASTLGIGRGSWWIVLLLFAGGAGLVRLLLFILFSRRKRH